jgi:hypothetical protein
MAHRAFNDQVSTDSQESQAPETTKSVSKRGALLDLSPQERQKIGRRIQKDIETWESTSSSHQANLRRWNDLLEGVIEETDYPWEGASQLHIPLVAIHLITLHSVIARSILSVDPLWYGKTLDKKLREIIPDIEEMATYKAKSELNVCSAVRDVIHTTGRDGLGWLMVPYVEEYERVNDVEVVEGVDEFLTEFPDAESAGMTEEEFQAKVEEVRANASPDSPMEIEVTVDRLVYRGPKAEVVDEADMMRVPMTARDLKRCRTYGRRIYFRKEELKERVREGALWGDAVERLIKNVKPASTDRDSWRQGQDRIEGVSRDTSKAADDYECFEVVVKMDRDGDGREEKYFATYSLTERCLLGFSDYIYRREIFIPFRMIKRSGRMSGKSIPELLEEMNHSIDFDIRMDMNNDAIRNVPIFKGQKSEKTKGFDPQADENVIRPGVFWWLDDAKSVSVVNAQTGNNADSVNRRQEVMRYAEMLVGPTQLLSGRESPIDPKAPGNKTIALIQQSNMRIEDYINELRGDGSEGIGFDALGDLIVSHYYQFGTDQIDYESTKEGQVVNTLRRTQLKGRFRMATHGVTATMNPEADFDKAMMWFQILSKDPMITSDKMRYRNLLNRLMLAGRLEGREELLPTAAEVSGEKDKELMAAAKEAVMQDLISKGLLPQPPAPGGPPAGLPPGIPGVPAVPAPPSMPGAPPGAVGLPPVPNLPALNGVR